MPSRNESGTKGRLLFLEHYLLEHTDDNHVLTTEDLLEACKEHGYNTQRNTLADDMAILSASGLDLIREQVSVNRTSMNGWHVGSRLFELAELKMLVDAVSSSRFITAGKSDALTEKLSRLTNRQNRASLTGKIYNADQLKTSNHSAFVIMDLVRSAIDLRRKLAFHYWDYSPSKEKILRHDGELYIASPYALIWNDDRYYLAAWSDKHDKVVKYRVDRMCDVEILEEPAVVDESFNAAEYSRRMIYMYDDDIPETRVTLLCGNHLLQNVLDRFGEETETEIADKDHVRAFVQVVPSSTFFGWVFQFQGRILIEGPEEILGSYELMLKENTKRQKKLVREMRRTKHTAEEKSI